VSKDLERQREFWNREIRAFDAIYSGDKSRLSVLLDSIFRWDMQARFEYTMIESGPIEGRSFLDVGCGTGKYSIALAKSNARRVVGLDISGEMVRQCRRVAGLQGVEDKCEFIQEDPLAFETGERFDISIAIGLFDYVRDPFQVLRKMRGLTTGRSIFSFPRSFTWRAPVRKARLALKGCDVFFYSPGKIEQLIMEAGYSSFRSRKVGQLYCVTAEC
jgi:SAM-dependent methyltransferase